MMRKASGFKSILFLYVAFFLLLVGLVLISAVYLTYITTIIRPDGQFSKSDWPQQYSRSFDSHISYANNRPQISDDGLASLKRNQLWIQFLDNNGHQIMAHDKPQEIPVQYTLSALLDLSNHNQLQNYTVFLVPVDNENSLGYIIGFPISISKTTLFLNSERYTRIRPVLLLFLAGLCLFVLIAGLVYGAWLMGHLSRIIKSADDIAARAYSPIRERGAFGDAYQSLNELNVEIQLSDNARDHTDRVREEWIANITHDLKTPLSPIKGYAELLSDGQCAPDEIEKYGQIILKNADYAEQLINDLKLTYQIESGIIPVHMQPTNLAREIKELVIDLLNRTDYANREIQFVCENAPLYSPVDRSLLRRAVTNILINALAHNPPETRVIVSLTEPSEGAYMELVIRDNGKGLAEEEINQLFTRYYRGANTDEKPEGSGLGLAIAKQIVQLHEGHIQVQSALGVGTSIILLLPKSAK